MRKILIGLAVVLVISAVAYLRVLHHRAKTSTEDVYAGNRKTVLWSTTAQIREPVATANFGDRLQVLGRYGDQVQVRTSVGIIGWASSQDLLSPEFMQQAKNLELKVATLPVEAQGHTRVLSNMHLDAGRESPRIRQLNKDIPVDLFLRQTVDVPGANPTPVATKATPDSNEASDSAVPVARKEDWWLVRAHLADKSSQSGWILGRFIDLNVPQPLPDYASAAGLNIVAWFELNHVTDSSGAPKPQYLVVGSHGVEGQACDFSSLRVFTWGNQRQRYETAFVDSDMCGKLPVTLSPSKIAGGDVSFSFQDYSDGPPHERLYRMHQTIVRRERTGPPLKPSANHTVQRKPHLKIAVTHGSANHQ